MKWLLIFCLLAVHHVNAMPNKEEEEVYDSIEEMAPESRGELQEEESNSVNKRDAKFDAAEEEEDEEKLVNRRRKRNIKPRAQEEEEEEDQNVNSRNKRDAGPDNGDGSSEENLDVDVNVNINAPQPNLKADVDVNVNINAGRKKKPGPGDILQPQRPPPTPPPPTTPAPWLPEWASMEFDPNFNIESYKNSYSVWTIEGARCPDRSAVAVYNSACEFTCTDDWRCPPLHLCCPNGCGRVCVPPVYQDDVPANEGCSVSFLVDFPRYESMNYNISQIFSLIWKSLNPSMLSKLRARLYFLSLDSYSSYFTPESVTSPCELEEKLNNFEDRSWSWSSTRFSKPTNILITILTEDGYQYFAWNDFKSYFHVFTTTCVIVVGNPAHADNVTQDQACVWRVNTFEDLSTLVQNINDTLQQNGCVFSPDTSCPTSGTPCDDETGCPGRALSCIDGTCQPPECPVPDRIPNFDYDDYFYYNYGRGKRSNEDPENLSHTKVFFKSLWNDQKTEEEKQMLLHEQQKWKEDSTARFKDPVGHRNRRSGLGSEGNGAPVTGFPQPGWPNYRDGQVKNNNQPMTGPMGKFSQFSPESNSESKEQAEYQKFIEHLCNDSKAANMLCNGYEGEDKKKCLEAKDFGDPRCKQTGAANPVQGNSAESGTTVAGFKFLRNGQPPATNDSKSHQTTKRPRQNPMISNRLSLPPYYFARSYYRELGSTGCCAEGLLKCSGVPAMCLYGNLLCDGVSHCINGEDEDPTLCSNRACASDEFRCNSGQCIEATGECDGQQQCNDGSDEHCQDVSGCPPSRSHYCSSGECIYPSFVCDNYIDCENGDDEVTCSCDGFKCGSGECMPNNTVCDGYSECSDGSDESTATCQDFVCPENSFKCGSGECIKNYRVCNQYPDCADGSDENDGACVNKVCPSGSWMCGNGRCIPNTWVCDSYDDCGDFSDESPEQCGPCVQFTCDSGICIPTYLVCNGYGNCPDNSDEQNCTTQACSSWEFQCTSGECISEYKVQDGREYCADGSDEYTGGCFSSYRNYQCTSGECIEENQICNGEYNCNDHKDEAICEQSGCPTYRPYHCESGQCIWNPSARCNGYVECTDGSDETNCESCQVRCDNGYQCISSSDVCNGYITCDDGSDEKNCENVPCSAGGFRCGSGECVSDSWRCDNYADCRDNSDERNCGGNTCAYDEFQCDSGECIKSRKQCDGDADCVDGSDEVGCSNFTCPSDRSFHCDSGECLSQYRRCNGRKDCLDGSDEANCLGTSCPDDRPFQCNTGQCIGEWGICDGYRECKDGSDETFCSSEKCPASRPFYCNSGECLSEWSLCNGWPDCMDGSDENCTADMCPDSRSFLCPSSVSGGICIPVNYVCDGYSDCSGGEDELDCENYIRECPGSDFRCSNNNCIPSSFICDGWLDCTDGEDEVGCAATPTAATTAE